MPAAFRLRCILQRVLSIRRRRLAEVATKRSHENFVAPEAVRQRNGVNRYVIRRQLCSCPLQLEAQRELLQRFAGDALKFTMQLKSRLTCSLCNCLQRDAAAQATSDVVQQEQKVVAQRHSGSIVIQQRSCDLIFLACGRIGSRLCSSGIHASVHNQSPQPAMSSPRAFVMSRRSAGRE